MKIDKRTVKHVKGFIEVTEIESQDRVLISIGRILSVLECGDCAFIETDVDKKGESAGVLVEENFDSIKEQIQGCEV